MASTIMSTVRGFCAPEFQAVADEFERNFSERGEVGAAVAIHVDGKPVVDLWGGIADRESGRAWQEDTLVTVYSSSKGIAAACMHMLIDRGMLDVDEPVARYWPEFAAHGKEQVTVAMLLSHQAGLPFWEEPLPPGALNDWEHVTAVLAKQAPIWEPGTQSGYHAITLGYLEGELVRRVTGRTIGQFLRDELAGPLGADAWFGLPESEEHRVATLYLAEPDPALRSALFDKLMAEPDWMGWKMITNSGGDGTSESANSRARRAAEIPAAGGVTNARGLARIYAPFSLDGSVDGVRIVDAKALPLMRTTRAASSCDTILRLPTTYTLGFSKSWGARHLGSGEYVIVGEHAFGTPGLGGNMGFADGQAQMSFGYTMNRHGFGTGLNERGQSLIDAAYRAVGFTSCAPGFWVR